MNINKREIANDRSITHLDQTKPVAGNGLGQKFAVLGLKQLRHTVGGDTPTTDRKEHSDDVTHHLMKKSIGGDRDMDKIPIPDDGDIGNGLDRRGHFSLQGRALKGLKIAFALKLACGFAH